MRHDLFLQATCFQAIEIRNVKRPEKAGMLTLLTWWILVGKGKKPWKKFD